MPVSSLLSTLHGSEIWTTYPDQKKRINAFRLRSLRRLLGISWMEKISNTVVLFRTGPPSMYSLLQQCRLRWLGHVRWMDDGRIPKDILYGELAEGKRGAGRPQLRFRDVCKRDMKALSMDTLCWEDLAVDRSKWRNNLLRSLKSGELELAAAAEEKRAKRKEKERSTTPVNTNETVQFLCNFCNRQCRSRLPCSVTLNTAN